METKRKFQGIWIPKEIWLSKDLSLQEKVFYVEICSLDNEDGCYAQNEYFAEFFGVSKTWASKIISSLVEKGFIISTIHYKPGTKQVVKRVLNKSSIGYRTKIQEGIEQNDNTPIEQSFKDNNTCSNNTVNSTDDKKIMSENKFSDNGFSVLGVDYEEVMPEEKRKKVAPKKEKVLEAEPWPTFEEFWDHYDKKVGKKEKIEKKWKKLTTRNKIKAMEHITLYKQSQPNKKYRKNPETYLNNDGWEDEILFTKETPNQVKFSRQTPETIIKNSQGW